MGYETHFCLTVSKNLNNAKKQTSEIDTKTEEIIAKDLFKLIFDDTDKFIDKVKSINYNVLANELKWYCYSSGMGTISKKYPDLYFALHGVGKSGYEWLEIFNNGNMVYEKEINKGDFF